MNSYFEVAVLTVLFVAIMLFVNVHDGPTMLQAVRNHLVALVAAVAIMDFWKKWTFGKSPQKAR